MIYVSGRIKDYPSYYAHFADESAKLRAEGHEVVNPCELGDPSLTYEQFMRLDLKALLECDQIHLLAGWEASSGARCEFLVAVMCGMKVSYE